MVGNSDDRRKYDLICCSMFNCTLGTIYVIAIRDSYYVSSSTYDERYYLYEVKLFSMFNCCVVEGYSSLTF
mgnify:FL=1